MYLGGEIFFKKLGFLNEKSADLQLMPNGVCGRCGRQFANALQLGAHVRTCRPQLRGAGAIIAVPVDPIARITLHSLARRPPSPWGRASPVLNGFRRGVISAYIRDYNPVRIIFFLEKQSADKIST